MELIQKALNDLKVGRETTFRNMTVFPLVDDGAAGEPDYITLDAAIAAHVVRITEVSEGGSVPELLLVNEGDRPVLIMDGEELVGAKQNRVLNLTILAPPKSRLVIPVSCVERGRWARVSRNFAPSRQAMYARGRAHKMAQVSDSLRSAGLHRADQGEVWRGIDCLMSTHLCDSDSAAMEDVYEQNTAHLDDYVRAFPVRDGQVGALVAIDGRLVGLEVFDHRQTFAAMREKLVRSYALDAIETRRESAQAPPYDVAEGFLAAVAASRIEEFPALGEGQDVRLSGDTLAGGALVAHGRVVQLSAFRLVEPADGAGGGGGGGAYPGEPRRARLRQASWRRGRAGGGAA